MSIFKEIEQKPWEYITLFGLLFLGGLIYFLTPDRRFSVCLISGFYFFWSLFHHYRRGDLHLSIVIEYLVFILLALIVTFSTL